MAEATLDAVRRRILASLDEMESARPARRWHGAPFEWVRRNHHVALGVIDLLRGIAQDLGEARVRALAEQDTPGGTPLVLQPTNPEAAELTVLVDWFDDIVQMYPGGRGRVEMWPARRESAESFLPRFAIYVNAVVSGAETIGQERQTRYDAPAETARVAAAACGPAVLAAGKLLVQEGECLRGHNLRVVFVQVVTALDDNLARVG